MSAPAPNPANPPMTLAVKLKRYTTRPAISSYDWAKTVSRTASMATKNSLRSVRSP